MALVLGRPSAARPSGPSNGWRRLSTDGAWCRYYLADGVEDPRRDTNVGAYVATGRLVALPAHG